MGRDSTTKKSYDRTFKERAVKLSCEKGNMWAAREYGVSYTTIVRWRKKYSVTQTEIE